MKRVMRPHDTGLIRYQRGAYGIQQTYAGLVCSTLSVDTRKSCYQGVGYRWQHALPGNRFVYIDGDGTWTGMRMTGWN